jgi:flagellar biosynthetic protein FliP
MGASLLVWPWITPDALAAPDLANELGKGAQSLPWSIMLLLTLLVFLPAMVLCMTPFVRLLVTFHFLRQALSTQNIPTNQTLIGLSLFLTWFIMQPVGAEIYRTAVAPLENNSVNAMQALDLASPPLRHFMLKYAREKDLGLLVELSKEPRPRNPDDVSLRVLIPAYILSDSQCRFVIRHWRAACRASDRGHGAD